MKCINDSNPFVLNYELPLPQHETIGNGELKLLDEANGIVDISVSKTLTSQCFITFIDEDSAKSFQKKGLKIRGRNIDIQNAKRDSLLALSLKNPSLLQRVLKSRRQRLDKEKRVNRRRSRRLRSKLRKKGLSEDEISNQVETQLSKPKREVKRQSDDGNKPRPTDAKVATTENPPNKVLLVQGLPQNCQLFDIEPIFQNDGFVEVRLVAIRKVAFVEYDSIAHATAQLNSMGGQYDLNGRIISIGFAK